MLKVFVGDDRVRITGAIQRLAEQCGVAPEQVNAETLRRGDLPSIFFGTSLFSDKRLVVVKDFSENVAAWEALPDFLEKVAEHRDVTVVLFEKNLDKRTNIFKQLKQHAEVCEMWLPKVDEKAVFKVFGLALSGRHAEAVQAIEKIKHQNESQMFFGLIASQVANLAALVFSEKPSVEVAKEVGVHAFALGQFERYRKDFSKSEMREMLKQFLDTDRALKTSVASDAWILIKKLILQIALR
ncbi:MAG: hypothetical protein LBQ02_02645 [Candidatus Nomurabacteria bacterium]|jgi:DNA polymerase III delta subunit|nr:hypothetical protein [Candidatus Nomurabacteria bacterium]